MKFKDGVLLFILGALCVVLLFLSAYKGAMDECQSRGANAAAIGRYGIYCINHVIKTVEF